MVPDATSRLEPARIEKWHYSVLGPSSLGLAHTTTQRAEPRPGLKGPQGTGLGGHRARRKDIGEIEAVCGTHAA